MMSVRLIYVIVFILLYANTIRIRCGCCCCGKTNIEYIEDKKMQCLIKDEENTEEMYKKKETEITDLFNKQFLSLSNEKKNKEELINTITEVLSEHKVGIPNIGATCYMNVIIQMISHHKSTIEKIIRRAFEIYNKGTIKENTVTASLAMLFLNIYDVETKRTKNIDISTIHMLVYFYLFSETKCKKGSENITYERFRVPNQNDAIEFFDILKDRINTEDGENNVLKHFELNIDNKMECKNCNYANTAKGLVYVLNLPINKEANNESLQDIINNELSRGEEIKDYKCDKCTKNCVLKKEVISSTNDNIIIAIKRYIFDEKTQKAKKINNFIKVNDILMINGKKYKLKAVINHSGTSNGGHYIININLKKLCYTFEDSSVYEDKMNSESKTAYMMLYEIVK